MSNHDIIHSLNNIHNSSIWKYWSNIRSGRNLPLVVGRPTTLSKYQNHIYKTAVTMAQTLCFRRHIRIQGFRDTKTTWGKYNLPMIIPTFRWLRRQKTHAQYGVTVTRRSDQSIVYRSFNYVGLVDLIIQVLCICLLQNYLS